MRTAVFKKRKIYGTASLLLLLVLCCIGFADAIQAQVSAALERCLTVLIPSLYAMMILGQLLTATGIWRILARPLHKLTSKLLHLPDGCFALFMLSQIAGYPVGAGMLRQLYQDGTLSKQDAGRLLCICYGSGPAFLLGLLGQQTNRYRLFGLILVSQVAANFFLLFFLFRKHPVKLQDADTINIQPLSASMLVECTASAGRSLLFLCGIVLAFSAFCAILDAVGFFSMLSDAMMRFGLDFSIQTMLESILEVTHAAGLSLPFFIQIPVLSGLLSFGGVCVILQIRAAAGAIFQSKSFLLCRVAAGLLSAGFCRLGMLAFDWTSWEENRAIMTEAVFQVSQAGIFPACMLVIMTVILLLEIRESI